MDKNVSVGDLRTFFQNTVCMYKNKPVKVREISNNKVFLMTDLVTQKQLMVEDALKYIAPPIRRLGMVNILGSVVYLKRMPYRKYQIGINKHNIKVDTLSVEYPSGRAVTRATCEELNGADIANCMLNIYPSLKESWEYVNEFPGAVAFDKQFAIDDAGNIHYKTLRVGSFTGKCKSVSDIVFNAKYKHLILLLDGNYEKNIRDFWPTTFA